MYYPPGKALKNNPHTHPKKVKKTLAGNVFFCKFTLTTNDQKNANSILFSKFPYISRAGGWLRQLYRSWLFDAFTPVFLFPRLKTTTI